MGVVSDTELFKRLKQGIFDSVYFLYGEEKYFISQALKRLIDGLTTPSSASFNLSVFEGDKLLKLDPLGELEDAIEVLPVMAQKKCVVLKNCDFDKLAKEDLDKMYNILSSLPDTTVLILCQLSAAVDMKKSAKYKKLAEAVGKVGTVCEFPLKDKLTLKRALCERASKGGVTMDAETAAFLIERCSNSYSILNNEMDKLTAYAKGGEITKSAIELCCVPKIEASAFELAKRILNNRFEAAYLLLDDLLFLRQEPVAVMSALAMAFNDIYRARTALDAGVSQDAVLSDFAYPKIRAFAVKNSFKDCKGISAKQIRKCITALYEGDIMLKSSKLDNRIILEQALSKMQLAALCGV